MADSINKPSHYTFGKYECIDAILKKLEYLDNLNNTVIRHERILGYLKDYAEKYFDAEN